MEIWPEVVLYKGPYLVQPRPRNVADFSSFGSSLDLQPALIAGFLGFSVLPSFPWVLGSFVSPPCSSVGVFVSPRVPRVKSVFSFCYFGNPDIRVPSTGVSVSVVMTPGRNGVLEGESGRRSRFSAARNRYI
ncbi:hypothetical protein NDU88_004560 [Pleurodeles waltl]|uniref:Uncharacterized protein n=1 Tax=Pleurodeles waltl TaxID=8319 RepID=A0AAV7RJZ4_PLEWA|nr:hypothetical protein NDU88_004560 [Pleurodeles waltl]